MVMKTMALVALLTVGTAWPVSAWAGEPATEPGQQDVELQLGQEVFDALKARGEIIATSSLYNVLEPIASRITKAAQPQYQHPFHFYLVHEVRPNAFATPGGNVYVTDSLLYFVKNTDELAGTLCHEVAHTIHHDTLELMEKRAKLAVGALLVGAVIHPTLAHAIALAFVGRLGSLGYSRDVEARADVTGSDICATAGYNPWGLVWLFDNFQSAKIGEAPEFLSDHPSNEHRVQALKTHFQDNPAVFGKFSPNPHSATPIVVPKNEDENFLR